MSSRHDACSRTARLINQVFFDGRANETKITDGLNGTRVRLVADASNLTSLAAQASVVASFQLMARIGIVVELDLADIPLRKTVSPLRETTIKAALLDLGRDLIPDVEATTELRRADEIFAFGSSPCPPGAIRIEADEFACSLSRTDRRNGRPIAAEFTGGAMAAAAAAASIALDAALPRIVDATGCALTTRPRAFAGPPLHLDLRDIFPTLDARPLDLGEIDAISGGAITNAFIQTILWLPDTTANVRVIERERDDLTNLNRYEQLRASDNDQRKIDVLDRASTRCVTIHGIEALYTEESKAGLLPLASTVLVGVDNVEARWCVQKDWPATLLIGATDNQSAILTTHRPGEPCAGCAHPDPLTPLREGDFIPTISFVSFWSGFMQALALASEPRPARRITIYPFGLGGPVWFNSSAVPFGARCSINCQASHLAA